MARNIGFKNDILSELEAREEKLNEKIKEDLQTMDKISLQKETDKETATNFASGVKPFKFYTPIKPTHGRQKGEVYSISSVIKVIRSRKKWTESLKSKGIYIETKLDGLRVIVHKDGTRVKIISEENTDLTSKLPTLVNKIIKMKKPAQFVAEGELELWVDGKHKARSKASGAVHEKGVSSKEPDLRWTPYDIVYITGKDIHNLPFSQRFEYLDQLGEFKPPKRILVKSEAGVSSAVKRLSARPGSEGAMLKLPDFIYELDGKTSEMLKFKKEISMDAKVAKVNKVAGTERTFNYDAVLSDNTYVGKTFNTNVAAKKGEVIEVVFVDITKYKSPTTGKEWFNWWSPRVLRKRNKNADSKSTAEKMVEATTGETVEKKMPKRIRELYKSLGKKDLSKADTNTPDDFFIEFLGTKGDSGYKSDNHVLESSIVINYNGKKIMIDAGESQSGNIEAQNPDYVLITHAHPDHVLGLKNCNATVVASKDSWNHMKDLNIKGKQKVFEFGKTFELDGIQIFPFKAFHSSKVETAGFKIKVGNLVMLYAPDILFMRNRDLILKEVDLYIGDGSVTETSLVRKEGEVPYGHASIKTQVNWCMKADVKKVMFTHFGEDALDMDQSEMGLDRWMDSMGVNAAFDGFVLTEKDILQNENKNKLYAVETGDVSEIKRLDTNSRIKLTLGRVVSFTRNYMFIQESENEKLKTDLTAIKRASVLSVEKISHVDDESFTEINDFDSDQILNETDKDWLEDNDLESASLIYSASLNNNTTRLVFHDDMFKVLDGSKLVFTTDDKLEQAVREFSITVRAMDSLRDYQDPYLHPPSEDKTWKYVLHAHTRGRSVHADLRMEVSKDILVGWTLFIPKGLSRVPVSESDAQALLKKEIIPVIRKKLEDPNVKFLAGEKEVEPHPWLKVQGHVKPGQIGATRKETGDFIIIDKGTVEYGTQKPHFHEYFIKGGLLEGRIVIRELANKAQWKKTGEGLLVWMFNKAKKQVKPYVISRRAVNKKWVPPFGLSALPKTSRAKVPDEFKYWKKKDEKDRIEMRDALFNALKKKRTDLQKKIDFVLQYQKWKGQFVVRFGPSREVWRLWLGNKHYAVQKDPIKTSATSAVLSKLSARFKTKEGEIKPGTPMNPTKKTPSEAKIIDKGKAIVLIDKPDIKKYMIQGKKMKGTWILKKGAQNIWRLEKSTVPKTFSDFILKYPKRRDFTKLTSKVKLPYTFECIAFGEGTWNGTWFPWKVIRDAAHKLVGRNITVEHTRDFFHQVGKVISVRIDNKRKRLFATCELVDHDAALRVKNGLIDAVSVRMFETHIINSKGQEECSSIDDFEHLALVYDPAVFFARVTSKD